MTTPPPPDPALASLERKQHVVRDHVEAVARGYKHGLFLYGSGGVGKSYTVTSCLRSLHANYKLFNSRMTAKGLWERLKAHPDAVHVLEDMERLTKDPDAQGVLRSALWAQPGHERKVTWTTAAGADEFPFRGGLILISNRPLADLPELRALATRIEVYHLEATTAELTALMRRLAAEGSAESGQPVLTPDECQAVTEHLLAECKAAGCPLDLRLQQKAFQSYRQHAADHAVTHWEDLVRVSVREAAGQFRHAADTDTPEVKQARRRNVVRAVRREFTDLEAQVAAYVARAKASRADFYRRKKEVEGGEFDAHDALVPAAADTDGGP